METPFNATPGMSEMRPPLEVGPVEPTPRKWPTVIGVVGIVLASLGLVCGCVGYFQAPLQRWGMEMSQRAGQPNPVAEAQLAATLQFQSLLYGIVTAGLLLGLWQLVSSIGLVKRRRAARGRLAAWAMAAIMLQVVYLGMQYLMLQSILEGLANANESARNVEAYIGAGFGGCMTVLFGVVWPGFVLTWMSRRAIVNEVQQWP